jgi:hypothetical protein
VSRLALRVVRPNDDGSTSLVELPEALDALVRECLAARPTVVLLTWEAAGGEVTVRSLPDAVTVRRGLIDAVFEHVHPEYLEE